MHKNKAIFLFPDYYDANTAARRILLATRHLFGSLKFAYWARKGDLREVRDPIFEGIDKEVFLKSAKPRSFSVFWLFIRYQIWLLRELYRYKPTLVHSFTFYTIFPAILYKTLHGRRVRVLYDPRDYIGVSYKTNRLVSFLLKFTDNVLMQASDLILFPDNQFFRHYGIFRLKEGKYFVLPNSSEDFSEEIKDICISDKYKIPKGKIIIPIIGYFSAQRARRLWFKVIESFSEVQFIVAGNMRDEDDLNFFQSHENVMFLGNISYKEALCIMKDAAFVPILYDPTLLNYKYAYPTKFYDSMMVGTPVLVSSGQVDVSETVRMEGVGHVVQYGDFEELSNIIRAYSSGEVREDSSRARELYQRKYNFLLIKGQLEAWYKTGLSE